jgi:hypothetical protein
MTSKSETVLLALFAAIEAATPENARASRNETLPERIPQGGLIILRDGAPGEPEVLLSPPSYYYEHRAEIDIIVDRPPDARDAAFDLLKTAVGAAIAADRTLGGLCDYVLGEAPAPLLVPIDGADSLKAATVPVVLIYGSSDPLL